jgi:hypothetical protein
MQEVALELDSAYATWTASYSAQDPKRRSVPPFSGGDGFMDGIYKNAQAAPGAASSEVRHTASRVRQDCSACLCTSAMWLSPCTDL